MSNFSKELRDAIAEHAAKRKVTMVNMENMEITEALRLCEKCGGDLDLNDPNGPICTICHLYECACTCDPLEVCGPDPDICKDDVGII